MRKFYSDVSIIDRDAGYAIQLDGKPVKTPGKALLTVRTPALADAIAEEWRAQADVIKPATMPLTQIASTAIDRVAPRRLDVVDGLLQYSSTDLLCYRALEPEDLVHDQADLFDPLLEWFEERTGATLVVVRGIMPVEQPAETLDRIRPVLLTKSAEELTAIQLATGLASSLVIGLALAEAEIDGQQAFAAANVEELHQIRKWGNDEEAIERLEAVSQEFDALDRFIRLNAELA